MLNISHEITRGRLTLWLRGELDANEAHFLGDYIPENGRSLDHRALRDRVGDYETIALDIGGVTFIDSTGLKELITLRRLSAAMQTSFVLTNLSRFARNLFAVAQIEGYFAVECEEIEEENDLEPALASW